MIKPLIQKAASYDIELDELALYAYAKHAQERNAQIAKLRSDMPDNGSGMSNDDAQAILDTVDQAGMKAQYEELHKLLMDLNAMRRKLQLGAGLITREEHDAWAGAYENYVPLRGFEAVDLDGKEPPKSGRGTGGGYNIRGKEAMRAKGRQSKAADIIENIITDYEKAVIRAEKNDVALRFIKLAQDNPDPALWELDATRTRVSLDRATGRVTKEAAADKGEVCKASILKRLAKGECRPPIKPTDRDAWAWAAPECGRYGWG